VFGAVDEAPLCKFCVNCVNSFVQIQKSAANATKQAPCLSSSLWPTRPSSRGQQGHAMKQAGRVFFQSCVDDVVHACLSVRRTALQMGSCHGEPRGLDGAGKHRMFPRELNHD
jgi:hypothetical protein